MKLEELFPEDMQIKKDRLNAADSLFYGEQDGRIRFMSIKIHLMP